MSRYKSQDATDVFFDIGLPVAAGVGLAWYGGYLSSIVDGPDEAGSGPGTATGSLSALDLGFRARLEALGIAMLAKGQRAAALETYRDPTRQAYYLSKGWSKTAQSFHNLKPAFAVDLGPASGTTDNAALAAFYTTLRDLAPTFGFRSGASYTPVVGTTWYSYGLGWDPGHLEPGQAGTVSPAAVQAGSSPW